MKQITTLSELLIYCRNILRRMNFEYHSKNILITTITQDTLKMISLVCMKECWMINSQIRLIWIRRNLNSPRTSAFIIRICFSNSLSLSLIIPEINDEVYRLFEAVLRKTYADSNLSNPNGKDQSISSLCIVLTILHWTERYMTNRMC